MGQLVFTPAVELFLPSFAAPSAPVAEPLAFEMQTAPVIRAEVVAPSASPICVHAESELSDAGYTCVGCRIRLVFCTVCMNKLIRGETIPFSAHVHAGPECDDSADRVCRRDFMGGRKRGAFE